MTSILIIEDDDTVRGLLRSVLEAEGYEVAVAANGCQGLARYRHWPTDLVITDIVMPELNDLGMIRLLTCESPTAKVIVISSAGRESKGLAVATRLGARQTFQKPLNMAALLNAVRHELVH